MSLSNLEIQINQLWENYHSMLTGYFVNKIGYCEDVQDLAAQTFARYFTSQVDSNLEVQNPKALLWKIADNLIKDYYKHKSTTKFQTLEKTVDIDNFELGTKKQTKIETVSEIYQCIKMSLTANELELLNQIYVDGQKYSQIESDKKTAALRQQNNRSKLTAKEKCKSLVKKLFGWLR
jgi:DNA-directed RNA polymerase specialized sigma24 family protein